MLYKNIIAGTLSLLSVIWVDGLRRCWFSEKFLENLQVGAEAVSRQVFGNFRGKRGILFFGNFECDPPPQAGNRAGQSHSRGLCLDSMAESTTNLSVTFLRTAFFTNKWIEISMNMKYINNTIKMMYMCWLLFTLFVIYFIIINYYIL